VDLPSRNRQLFERAGWLFVEPEPRVASAALITRRSVRDAEAVQQVFVDRSGNIQVSTDVITVQVDPAMSESEAMERIQADGLRLARRIGFVPNTFEVRAADQRPLADLVQDRPDATQRAQ
jgi:hypothetical protein